MIRPRHIFTSVLLISVTFAVFVPIYLISFEESNFRLPLQELIQIRWCKKLRKMSKTRNPVGLVSAPGCGNTWLRFLLQQATGILTGSVYNDTYLHMVGFPGEYCNDGSMLVVKTHLLIKIHSPLIKFDSVILLIRNPRDSILATYNSEFSKKIEFEANDNKTFILRNFHINVAPPSVFKRSPSDWSSRATFFLHQWTQLYTDWLTNYHGPIHVVFYENLINNTKYELQRILDFLNITVSEYDIECAIERQNDLDYIYRRVKKYKYFDPFTPELYKEMELAKKKVYSLVKW